MKTPNSELARAVRYGRDGDGTNDVPSSVDPAREDRGRGRSRWPTQVRGRRDRVVHNTSSERAPRSAPSEWNSRLKTYESLWAAARKGLNENNG